ncbi:hypothetical protein CERSUDRAFT_69044 [Gelatoporia subvermispora B]|uniref:DUF6533 domain-containing protein n=1 Tax=Ceriporiopsis subvermispora (strain B) TaxID=914234 RepID=M2QZI9_CERS8|nr:hypothetical protein CERSUDRAFT_69044 [Gelatoporia subvermispora B]
MTLSDEVEYIWRRRFSSVTLLFFLNRLALLLWTSLKVYINFGLGTTSTVAFPIELTLSMRYTFIASRVYALSKGQLVISVIIFVFGVSGVLGYLEYAVTGPQPVESWFGSIFWTCAETSSWTGDKFERYALLILPGRSAISALADLSAIIMTCRKVGFVSQAYSNTSITSILLRDGAPVRNSTLLLFRSISSHRRSLQAIIVSHFLLNLRDVACKTTFIHHDKHQALSCFSESGDLDSQQSGIRFVSFLAPMGGSLDLGSADGFDTDVYGAGPEVQQSSKLDVSQV